MNEYIRAALIDYAKSFLGLPYRWAGDDPMGGFDCSGYVQEVLCGVGLDPPEDQTAHALFTHFSVVGRVKDEQTAGDLLFFGSWSKIVHVAIAIDSYRMIEAGGGGKAVETRKDAEKQNAYIRIRPVSIRRDLFRIIEPDHKNLPNF